ncbi:MAG: hypothetical protein GXO48_06570 [Chlorobi bacterium]|nr:hypothetical protein [Chlorobiota bacterium]
MNRHPVISFSYNDNAYTWFCLYRTKGIGNKKLHSIYRDYLDKGIDPSTFASKDDVIIRKEFMNLRRNNVHIIHKGHHLYPAIIDNKLKDTAPFILFSRGNLEILKKTGIAIVGSRHASDKGKQLARRFASQLAEKGLSIISGYAKGIDENAHLGALLVGGSTIAVLSYGILEFKMRPSFRQIKGFKNNFLAVSQFAPNDKWKGWRAMERNKLVCALSHAVIVIESGPERDPKTNKMSGTFHAAKTSLGLKTPLFVVDPDFLPSQPEGNKQLIKMGGISINPDYHDIASEIINKLHENPNRTLFTF